ncbi:MAG: hypothetical protein ACX939_08185 [Hyphococcus sp.]
MRSQLPVGASDTDFIVHSQRVLTVKAYLPCMQKAAPSPLSVHRLLMQFAAIAAVSMIFGAKALKSERAAQTAETIRLSDARPAD